MVQGIMELLFDAAYLITAMTIGIYLIVKGKGKYFKLFGFMALVLSVGDAFHLVPRVYALLTTGLEANIFAIGLGKLITSITMTCFYVILYFIWELKYKPSKKVAWSMRVLTFAMAITRIVFCACPQNKWFVQGGNLLLGIARNIPFAIMGIQMIVLCFLQAKRRHDTGWLWMGVMVILSFGFYVPVVLLADTMPIIGVLMIPKTLAYVGIVVIGLVEHKKAAKIAKFIQLKQTNENAVEEATPSGEIVSEAIVFETIATEVPATTVETVATIAVEPIPTETVKAKPNFFASKGKNNANVVGEFINNLSNGTVDDAPASTSINFEAIKEAEPKTSQKPAKTATAKSAPAAKAASAKPATAKAPVAKAPAAKAVSAKPATAKAPVAKAPAAKSASAKPATAKAPAAKSASAKPATAKAPVAKAASAKPATAKAPVAKAASAKPATAKAPSKTTK